VLVATRTFIDPDDGCRIRAGVTYVSEDSDVAFAFPERFKPATNSWLRAKALLRSGHRRTDRSVFAARPDWWLG
jgi:hypothetical protein